MKAVNPINSVNSVPRGGSPTRWAAFFPLILSALFFFFPLLADQRYYIGETGCRQCHYGPEANAPFNNWYLSKHARGFAALAMPESQEIARLSGIDVDPFDSPVCLKCHATATDTEAWRRNETFYIADGVQCEECHGAGSDYAEGAVMADKQAAAAAGLHRPTETDCLVCHKPKGSHTAVLNVRPFDFETFKKEIGHSGAAGDVAGQPFPPLSASDPAGGYLGVMTCAGCHGGAAKGYVFSKWRLSAHAEAYARLASGKRCPNYNGPQITGNPQQAEACLICHATGYMKKKKHAGGYGDTFTPVYGVQCESCHGPGGNYAAPEVMNRNNGTHGGRMPKPGNEVCIECHKEKSFNYKEKVKRLAHAPVHAPGRSDGAESQKVQVEPVYKTPFNLTVSRDGKRLYVVCEASDSLVVTETATGKRLGEVPVQNQPHGICISDDERYIYISNRGSDSVTVIDAAALRPLRVIAVGDEPHGVALNRDNTLLFTANAGSNDVSVVCTRTHKELKRLSAARGAWAVSRSPVDDTLQVTNNLSHFVPFRTPSVSEVTVIDGKRGTVRDRIMIPEANLVQGIAHAPDASFSLVTLIRTKNLIPMTRVLQGWVLTNGMGILHKDGSVDQLLLDENDSCFADPTDIVITPNGTYAYVTGGGIDAVAVVNLEKLKAVIRNASPAERKDILPNHLGLACEFVERRIAVGRNPRGLAVSPDGAFVYTANALDDTVSVIDVASQTVSRTIHLGGPREITLTRRGERIFHNAFVTFGRQFSCHTCHPDGGIDNITYDIEPDGLGVNPVDNRTLRGILDTAPFKWTGKNKTLSRQCGPRLAVFFTRIDPFTPEEVKALERYICTIPRNPNRYRTGSELTEPQRRGKLLFERTHTNGGKPIPRENRCNVCHSGPYFTNRERVDVGTRSHLDTQGLFDVPHLNNIYESAPYLHDGRAETLEEIWTRFNNYDQHGVTNDMTKDQLNDLIEYLKTL